MNKALYIAESRRSSSARCLLIDHLRSPIFSIQLVAEDGICQCYCREISAKSSTPNFSAGPTQKFTQTLAAGKASQMGRELLGTAIQREMIIMICENYQPSIRTPPSTILGRQRVLGAPPSVDNPSPYICYPYCSWL